VNVGSEPDIFLKFAALRQEMAGLGQRRNPARTDKQPTSPEAPKAAPLLVGVPLPPAR
jgi:hypothetical protein